jgi:formylglycine-generating enzyme required for sulfatase activity
LQSDVPPDVDLADLDCRVSFSDAEWEYATQYEGERDYPWGNRLPSCSRANYGYCVGSTTPVGSHPAAPAVLALYDMAGNVWEWCDDRHVCSLGTEPVTDPRGPASGSSHVVRGGAGYTILHLYYAMHCAYRGYLHPAATNDYLGFRYVRSQ